MRSRRTRKGYRRTRDLSVGPELNFARFVAAELYFSLALQASREMYDRSYFSLGVGERAAVDQTVWAHVLANFQGMTADWVTGLATGGPTPPMAKPVGFQADPGKKL